MNNMGNDIWEKKLRKTKESVSRKIAGETILVPIAGKLADMQRIFSLNPVAEFIWKQMDEEKRLSEIRDDILNRFDVGRKQAEDDIREFVSDLLKEGLVTEAD